MVRRRVRDDETRVVVHEDRQVHALVASEQKRENVRLPELIRSRPLESTRRMLSRLGLRRRRRKQALLVKDASYFGLAHAQRGKAGEHIANAPRAVFRMLLAQLNDGRSFHLPVGTRRLTPRRSGRPGHQCIDAACPVRVQPVIDCRPADPRRARDAADGDLSTRNRFDDAQPNANWVGPSGPDHRAAERQRHC
jgi:hypothetical protein